jgi:hypothetical protein
MISSRRQSPFVAALLLWNGRSLQQNGVLAFFNSRTTTRNSVSAISSTTFRQPPNVRSTSLHALIYGWDDYDEDDATATKNKNQPKPLAVDTSGNSLFGGPSAVCDAAGSRIADHLTSDRDQMGSLARLAFAFRPKEHSGLSMKEIETVHVLCVKQNEIEVEAILCESLGCVSLHIPIQFPTSCTSSDEEDKFQSCVLQNLKDLDVTASSQVSAHLFMTEQEQTAAANAEWLLAGSVQLPTWWVSPSSTLNAASLETECETLKEILNEDEFQSELLALAQDGLKHSLHGDVTPSTPMIQKAKCAIVGPAGIGIKALAKMDGNVVVMDVLFPFGGAAKETANSIRAAVLGAVAVAAEQQL